jgi:hypothetical protein
MSDNEWGFGDPEKARHIGWSALGENRRPIELLYGEHKHSYNDNRFYAKTGHGEIFEFDGHRVLIDVEIKSHNYLKESHLSGDQIRKGGSAVIKFDGEPVFEFFFRDPQWALLRAHHLIGELVEHASGVATKKGREELVGRKVYYREVPAVIERLLLDQVCVIIRTESGEPFPSPVWRDAEDDEGEATIKDQILSPHIWWFRE